MQSEDAAAPLMTIISQRENGVEQTYLFTDGMSEDSHGSMERPYIVWHVRELDNQHVIHFYITRDFFPLNSVWVKQICTTEGEAMSNYVATKRKELQTRLQVQFNEAIVLCGFDNFEAFTKVSFKNGMFTVTCMNVQ